jgi:phage shock protein C
MSGEYKRLYRSRDERMISGVCGGIAKYFNVDPTLIRLLFVIFAFAGGPGLLAYIVLAIIVPEEPAGYEAPPAATAEPPATVEAKEPQEGESE